MRALFALCALALGCPIPPPAFCGDGFLDAGESCDDRNNLDADGCEADCSLPACENGILDPGEVCLVGPVSFGVGFAPREVVAADFNRDGAPDLATGTSDESISLLLGDGAGGFSRGADVPLLGASTPLVVADFDGDGALDLATSLISGPDSVPVVRGDGAGGFSSLATLPATPAAFSLVVGDFNGDGAPDIATGDAAGDGVSLHLNSREGGFLVPRSFASGERVSSLVPGDFDGNGALDLAVALSLDAGLLVLLGDGQGGFSALPLLPLAASSLVAGDFNGDELPDLGAGRIQSEQFVPLLGDGAGGFSAGSAVEVGAPLALAVADFNGDELPDIAAALPFDPIDPVSAHLAVLLGDGAGAFSVLPLLPLGLSDPRGVVVADFNGDEIPDVALSDQTGARLQIFFSAP